MIYWRRKKGEEELEKKGEREKGVGEKMAEENG